jgi:hypothetical protein
LRVLDTLAKYSFGNISDVNFSYFDGIKIEEELESKCEILEEFNIKIHQSHRDPADLLTGIKFIIISSHSLPAQFL